MDESADRYRCAVCGTALHLTSAGRVTVGLTSIPDEPREVVIAAGGVEVHRCMSPASRRLHAHAHASR